MERVQTTETNLTTVETTAETPTLETAGEGEAVVAVEPTPPPKEEETSNLVPAVLAVVVAVTGLVVALKKFLVK